MVNGTGVGKCRRIIHHPPIDQHRPAQRLLYLCRDGKEETGGEVPVTARPGQLPIGFASAHFLLVTGSPVRVTRPFSWPAPLVLLPFLGVKGGSDLLGLGLLDW